jgi:hypothetical protein
MDNIRHMTIEQLERAGYAIILWSPDELDGINPDDMEAYSIEKGHDFILYNDINRVG